MNSLVPKLNVKKVKTALKTLPQGSDAYDIAYTAAMDRISAQGKEASEMAKKTLSWILCARRPLSTLELLHALAVEVDETEIDRDNILDPEQLLTLCAGLVTIDEASDNVRFIHYTTQEYLQRTRETWFPYADVEIARICTAYLSLDELSAGPCSSKQDFDRRIETLALLDYAAVHWGAHMNVLVEEDFASDLGSEVVTKALVFLSNGSCLGSASQALFMSGRTFFPDSTIAREGEGFSGSHWIGRFGLAVLFRRWDSGGAQRDNRDVFGRTPLSWAAGEGHEVVSKLLLETGKVDADSKDYYCQTPLSWASRNGREAIVKLLLEFEVDVNSKDCYGQTPLLFATQHSQEGVVKLLLGANMVEVDSRDHNCRTPLSIAVRRKDEATVKLLLNTRQADVESKNLHGETPLSFAATEGHEGMLKLLLDSSSTVGIESRDEYGKTLLSLASEYGQAAIVKLLLDTGKADVNSKDGDGRTPLLLATRSKHEAVINVLLDTGKVDIDSKDNSGRTPLLWASRNGQEVVVQLLLDTGKADINARDSNDWTPLLCATEKGDVKIVKLLQEAEERTSATRHISAAFAMTL
jgi:ankyrin repeat protein